MTYFFLRITAISLLFIMGFKQSNICLAGQNKYAAIVVDGNTGRVLHAEHAYEQRHPASLTKKMTLYILFEALESGKITLKTRFPVSFLATRQAPSKLGLRVGETITVEAIIKAMVTKSANDASVVAAEGLAGSVTKFVHLMNRKAKQLGMHSTQFFNPTGLPDRRQITTAMDMAILAQALYQDFPQHYHYFKTKSFNYLGISHRNHNHMLGKIDGLDGIKTGFICASGFNISTSALRYDVNNKPRRLFAVVMGGTSWRSRDKRAAELLEANFRKIGAVSAKPPKFLPAPGTKGVMSKKDRKRQIDIESPEFNNDAKEGFMSKDAKLLEASLRQNETYFEPQLSPQDDEEMRNTSAMMQSQTMQTISYAPPIIYPSQTQQYAEQPTVYNNASPSSQPQGAYYSTPSYPNYNNAGHAQAQTITYTQPSDQMLEYLQSTETLQTPKKITPTLEKAAKKEKFSQNTVNITPDKRVLPAQWVVPKPPAYKEISLSPSKKVNSFKKEKSFIKKIAKKTSSSRKRTI